jgi:homoserine dehydrogenase
MITELVGIFNGTTNFILTKLAQKSFDEVLQEAITLGYAEADHHNDTEGLDTRNKLIVASKLAFGVFLNYKDILVSGITGITKEDVGYAKELGYAIKLLGISRIVEDDKLTAFVGPALVPQTDPLARIEGVDNSIWVHDKFRGVQGMSAAGAGKDATAMAIFSDLVSVGRGEKTLWPDAALSHRNLKFTRNQLPASFYVRVDVRNQPGVLANISKHFARNKINITDVIQRSKVESPITAVVTSIVFMLGPTKQKSVQKVLDELGETTTLAGKPVMLRIEQSVQADATIAHSWEESAKSVRVAPLQPQTM